MRTDEEYYDDLTEDENKKIKYQPFSAISINTKFDISAQYCLSGGKFSPLCNFGVVYGGKRTTAGKDFINSVLNRAYYDSYCGLFLVKGSPQSGDIGNLLPTKRMPANFNTYKNFYTISSRHASWDTVNANYSGCWEPYAESYAEISRMYPTTASICTDFRYAYLVLYITVTGYSSPNYEGTAYGAPLDEYDFDNYPYITRIIASGFYYGKGGGETSDNRSDTIMSIGRAYEKDFIIPYSYYSIEAGDWVVEDVSSNYSPTYNMIFSNDLYLATDAFTSINLGTSTYDTLCTFGKYCQLYSLTSIGEPPSYADRSCYSVKMTKEEAEKIVSTYGLYWTGTRDVAISAVTGSNADSDLLRCPVADSDGVFRGKFYRGRDIAKAPNADWGIDDDDPYGWKDDNGVIDDPFIDDNDYTDDTPLNTPTITAFGAFNRAYAMTQQSLNDLSNYLWNQSDNVFQSLVQGLALFGNNPMDALIDCRMYPFPVTNYLSNSGAQKITLGRTETDIYGVYLGNTSNCVIDMGSCVWQKYHTGKTKQESFLDYSPYSQGVLYVPYVGMFDLSADKYAGQTLHVYLIVDFMTGVCEVAIYRDRLLMETRTGQMGVNIPMSGVNAAQWAMGVMSGIGRAMSGVGEMAGSIKLGSTKSMQGPQATFDLDVGDYLKGLGDTVGGICDAVWTPLPVQQHGVASAGTAQWLPQKCYLFVSSPENIEPSTYGHSVGYACEKSATLGALSGFTKCINPDVSGFGGTQIEKHLLETLLENGVDL